MNIEFKSKGLAELYQYQKSNDKKCSKLPSQVVKQFIKVVNYIRNARDIEELKRINSLHYEKKKGKLKGKEYVRINSQYRLLLESVVSEEGIICSILLIEISNHYE